MVVMCHGVEYGTISQPSIITPTTPLKTNPPVPALRVLGHQLPNPRLAVRHGRVEVGLVLGERQGVVADLWVWFGLVWFGLCVYIYTRVCMGMIALKPSCGLLAENAQRRDKPNRTRVVSGRRTEAGARLTTRETRHPSRDWLAWCFTCAPWSSTDSPGCSERATSWEGSLVGCSTSLPESSPWA